MRSRSSERGASAVEFALVAPLLFVFLLAILSFGYAYHIQTVLSNAARDAVRVMALQDTTDGKNPMVEARKRAVESGRPSVDLVAKGQVVITDDAGIEATSATCDTTGSESRGVEVIITYPIELLGGFGEIIVTGKGTMRCNG